MQHPALLDDPIRVPSRAPEPRRASFPFWALVVPVVGAVVLWQVTGSPTVLWFAALGPLVALASILDAGRMARRERRRAQRREADDLRLARAELDRRHAAERAALWRATPDADRLVERPDGIWRAGPGREVVVVGSGSVPSRARIDGDAAAEFRREAAVLADAPIDVPLTAGIAVVGPRAASVAVARALVAQICLAHPPGAVQLIGVDEEWADALPHAQVARGLRLWWGRATLPPDVDATIICAGAAAPPPQCSAILRLIDTDEAELTFEGSSTRVRPAAWGAERAAALVDVLRGHEAAVGAGPLAPMAFDDLPQRPDSGSRVAIGAGPAGPVEVDLVDDGPHAIVVGMTGSGKSELLVTWVTALARSAPPDRVNFLLVDFKGGRAFDALAPLPHVVGVVTDLDECNAVRAVESLTAEIRRRERVLAEHGARDIGEIADVLPRLVIVVDEYAALTRAHPGMHDLFADLAARGRALGLHLVLATQRAEGFRDAVLANAPLRIALRVADAADSRTVLGCSDAAALPGGVAERGTALVRRAADTAPQLMRVSLCPPAAVERIARSSTRGAPARRPWLPPLPSRVALDGLRRPDTVVLGVADEPAEQRRRVVCLEPGAPGAAVLGRAGSGRTTLLRTIAVQAARDRLCWVPDDLEQAWDVIAGLDDVPRGWVVVVDDLDLLLTRMPDEYAAAAAASIERCAREARARGISVVCAAQRITGAVGRIVDQLPDRAVLAAVSRSEHIAFGGDPAHHDPAAPAGRGRWHGALVQFADTAAPAPIGGDPRAPSVFRPSHAVALVAPPTAATRIALHRWRDAGIEVRSTEETTELRPGRVVWGTPEAWLGRWRAAAAAVAGTGGRCQLVVDAGYGSELRLLTGNRALPPFAHPGGGRAWLLDTRSDRVRRVILTAAGTAQS
ncbi:FtsK/SpoIIIE domain-containing protein [Microbacterium sp. cf332]|uniref:FtsK/SpoIIIE domain-containing protein n=1 Tax=Microbacterium sp. cf332 TaxID=1761804 RepID=UPI0008823E2B|nr:FtsK/SpoIIIE domain-containing protein [Microbacterium sp. cf332]SDQ83116.1 FtsK/SpoIIIE family protein [Microbacterium sp. cf332]